VTLKCAGDWQSVIIIVVLTLNAVFNALGLGSKSLVFKQDEALKDTFFPIHFTISRHIL